MFVFDPRTRSHVVPWRFCHGADSCGVSDFRPRPFPLTPIGEQSLWLFLLGNKQVIALLSWRKRCNRPQLVWPNAGPLEVNDARLSKHVRYGEVDSV